MIKAKGISKCRLKDVLSKVYLCMILLAVSSCSLIFEDKNEAIKDDIYRFDNDENNYLLTFIADTVIQYLINDDVVKIDSKKVIYIGDSNRNNFSFYRRSLDLDIITIPFKYRSYQSGVPNQINTSLNGAIFLGSRIDNYKVNQKLDLLNNKKSSIVHSGWTYGLFIGLDAVAINPTTTNNEIDIDYEGLALMKGVSILYAKNDYTFGASIGFDNLIDKNSNKWIYEFKPWLGFTLGINLN